MKRLSVVALVLSAVTVSAQPALRRTTNLEALRAQPGFYHQRQVLLAGELTLLPDGRLQLSSEGATLPIVASANVREGLSQVRGTFWDIGRLNPDDPRLSTVDVRGILRLDPNESWPSPGQVLVLVASAIVPATPPSAPSIRALVLYPTRYVDQTVTITGQYGGRNLLGDLPASPGNSRWDFVLRTTDAALWVSNIQPRGRDFNLALDARFDTGRWLQVTGVLRSARGLQWIDATTGTVALAKPIQEAPDDDEVVVAIPAAPPPEVVFSVPIQDELRVATSSNVRIQFSRDIRPGTFAGHVQAVYIDPEGADRVVETPIPLTVQYTPANRVLQVRFNEPLSPFRVVKVMLTEGILGADDQPLAPWSLSFTTAN